ncbi:uncharacterized protein [Leuresthes tenuis]|uniref:uncharacterized protein n=1 Tax=Leuresthes tenuis TaxID=355514 RepID=UPI003B500B8C
MYRKEVEISFIQRIREVEDRFSGDQECVAERFQADVLKLEQHYQSELKSLSESHVTQKLHWEAEMQKALEIAEEQRKAMEEAMKEEKEGLNQEWEKERQELEIVHSDKIEALMMENKQLQNELDEVMSKAQSKEIELSMQLNDLHNRLQEKHELVSQSESKALQIELLLNQTVEDFKQERAELLSNCSELETKFNEMLPITERQARERIQLLTERDDLKMKIEELEMFLRQAAVDFELERQELQENLSILETKVNVSHEVDGDELRAERDLLKIKIKELEMELSQLSAPAEEVENNQMKGSTDVNTKECISVSGEDAPHNLLEKDGKVSEIPDDINADQDFEDGSATSDDQANKDWLDAAVSQDYQTAAKARDLQNENVSIFCEGCDDEFDIILDHMFGDLSLKKGELFHEGDHESESPDSYLYDENENKAVPPQMQCEPVSSLETFGYRENKAAFQSCNKERKPQDAPDVDFGNCCHEDEKRHETVVGSLMLEVTGDPGEQSVEDAEVNCLLNNSHDRQEVRLVLDSGCEHLAADVKDENHDDCAHDCVLPLDEDSDRENREGSLPKLQALYNTATEENVLLHEKISLLQQKTEILENLLAHHSEKIKTGHQALEENYSLKVQTLLLMDHVKELEVKALEMTDLEIRYEDCMCENAKLKEQNDDLEKRVWSLEGRINIFHDFQDQHVSLVDEIGRMRGENAQLFLLLSELERQDGLPATHPDAKHRESPTGEAFMPLGAQLQAETHLEDCCKEFEMQNTKLRRAITELQDQSQTLNETTQAHG